MVIPELLDVDAGTPQEIENSLADLRRVNRWFGGVSTTRKLLRQVFRTTRRGNLSLLDVASGSGDVPREAARQLRNAGTNVRTTYVDRSRAHLPHNPGGIAADALALPFADSSFDVVSCALFAHHLEPDELVRFVTDGLRVARVAVLINDLRRGWLHLGLIYAGFPLFRSRLTRHDAPASVRRAYTSLEMHRMLSKIPAARVEIHRSYLCRMGIIVWRGEHA